MAAASTNETAIQAEKLAWPGLREAPLKFLGLSLLIFFRLFYGLFFFQAGLNKILSSWDAARVTEAFTQRLTELNPDSFASIYLENFAIPMAGAIAFVITWGEFVAGAGLLLGLMTRSAAILAFFILLNIAIGGYYDASLLPFFAMNITFIFYPLGRKFGLDRYFHRRYPQSFWFR